jgi:pyridoxine/pyridoxamine 5'-phosphate oxidase
MSDTSGAAEFTAADREFLATPRMGFLTVPDGTGFPQPRPVWFEVTEDGVVQLFSETASPKIRRLRRDPRASLVAAGAIDEPARWVAVSGSATVEEDGVPELADRLARRYWDLDDPARAAELRDLMQLDLVRIVIRPERISRYGG